MKLKDLGTIFTGNTPKKSDKLNYNSNDICFVKPSDISEKEITHINHTEYYIANHAYNSARLAPKNSILVTCIGIIGKIAILEKECAFNQQINAIIPNEKKIIPYYLAYALKYKKKSMQDKANAPVVPIINKTEFSEINIKVPSLEKQKKIVNILIKIDKIINWRFQQLNKLNQLVSSLFMELFGSISKSNHKKLSDVCKIITDGTHQSQKFVDKGIPFLLVSNITENKIKYNTKKYITRERYDILMKRTPIDLGDILLSTVGSYGHAAIVKELKPFSFQRHIAYLKPDQKLVDSVYLHSAILSEFVQYQIETHIRGIAQKTLNLADIREIKIPVPSKEDQKIFKNFITQIDKSKLAIQQSLEKLETLKKSLMQEYFG